eukprot:COSAG05_NODE_1486_length_4730_cov_147.028288_3_plen_128_part_00
MRRLGPENGAVRLSLVTNAERYALRTESQLFAPWFVCRSFHYIATAQGSSVRVWQLETTDRQGKEAPSQTLATAPDEAPAQAADAGEVWRVRWNITGTVLASSGDDGHVRLWKPDPISGNYVACSAT